MPGNIASNDMKSRIYIRELEGPHCPQCRRTENQNDGIQADKQKS